MEGYDAKFDPPLDKRLECPICLLAQREPMQTPCGHRFCSACILRALSETGTRCPVDNTKVAVHQLFKDNFAKREVLSLHVHCHAEEHGCVWEGELRNLESHEKTCGLVAVSCPNECGHVCQRKSISTHLPLCSNCTCLCVTCSILYPRNKLVEHEQYCSKIKIPDSILENIAKSGEILKWSGHLKMKVHGQNYSAVGYLSANVDSEEQYIYSGCWSSNINLIPLMGAASKLFWKTLQGPEVKPVQLYFGIINTDSKSSNFQKMLKKKVNAVIGLRLKPTSRRELMIMYIHWNESQKRLIAYVAELRNYLVREMQRKLQPLRRSSQYAELSESIHSYPTRPNDRSGTSSRSRGYGGSVRVINVPPTMPAASIENHNHGPSVVPSILSWQLSPSFPAYPWRVQAGGPSVPFFTIPSTPPQFLPAHSYPYTFAPMPAIAAPPFSINPIQPVPAPLTIPSYAGVAVPQVSGLHSEVVVSSASNTAIQGPSGFVEGPNPNPSIPHIAAAAAGTMIHPYAPGQNPSTLSIPPAVPHPVNQVSVVVDPRLNPRATMPTAEPRHDGRNRLGETQGQWSNHSRGSNSHRPHPLNEVMTQQQSGRPSNGGPDVRYYDGPSHIRHNDPTGPGPSGMSNSGHRTRPLSNPLFGNVLGLETSDDDSDLGSPFHWSLSSSSSLSDSPHNTQYTDPPTDYISSELTSPSTRGSGDEAGNNSPSSHQRAMGSALQTLADAAALLSSSPQSVSNSSDDNDMSIGSTQSNTHDVGSSAHAPPHSNVHSTSEGVLRSQEVTVLPSGAAAVAVSNTGHHAAMFQGGHNRVLTIGQPSQTNVYNNMHTNQLATGFHHHGHPAAPAHLEELPVFLPVIHQSMDTLEPEPGNPIPTAEAATVLYTPHETGVVVTSRPVPIADVPPLIHLAAPPPPQRNMLPSDQWSLVDQRTSQQVATAPPNGPAPTGFIRSQPVMGAPPPHSGGFWEEVMPSLDMRLHEAHTN